MASPTLTEARGLEDILDTSSYRFEIGQIPGAQIDSRLSVQCTQATYPGVTNEVFQVVFSGGHELSYRGRKVFPKQLSVTYVETVEMNVTQAFGNWFEYIAGTDSGNAQGYKRDYAIDGPKLYTYDLVGNVADVVTFFGLQVQDKPDVSYDPGSAQPYTINITLTYDFYFSALYGLSGLSAITTNANT
jgi:hypothetical protein